MGYFSYLKYQDIFWLEHYFIQYHLKPRIKLLLKYVYSVSINQWVLLLYLETILLNNRKMDIYDIL